MIKFILILTFVFLSTKSFASVKGKIINNLDKINNLSFNFEQNINGKSEKGNCILEYPKKIFCKYDLKNKKILVSNGKSLVIKTISSYYNYPLKKTPLNLILDKNYLLNRIKDMDINSMEKSFISFKFVEDNNIIKVFFDKKNFNLIGWQTTDIYQNLSITYLSSIIFNQKIKKRTFNLPSQN